MTAILEINGLSKRYGKIQAVNNLSLKVETGNIYGILGPNGSGKTTTLGIILGVINANQGDFSWFGERKSSGNRKRIGAILETPNFYTYLSAVNNLKIVADIKEVSYDRIDPVLKLVNLYDRRNDPMSNYSLGMKQRLALASSLLADPEVLVLDEPTNGLDPQGIADVREVIQKTAREGKTIIIASHILDEIEKICTHVAVIKKGNLLASGSIQNVLSKEDKIELMAADLNKLESVLSGYNGIKGISREGSKVIISITDTVEPDALNKYLFESGVILSHLSVSRKSLESAFLELTAE
jgi:ABC-type multidrug transport system ATPase subunit